MYGPGSLDVPPGSSPRPPEVPSPPGGPGLGGRSVFGPEPGQRSPPVSVFEGTSPSTIIPGPASNLRSRAPAWLRPGPRGRFRFQSRDRGCRCRRKRPPDSLRVRGRPARAPRRRERSFRGPARGFCPPHPPHTHASPRSAATRSLAKNVSEVLTLPVPEASGGVGT
jgi:hypothetical protein